MKINTIEDVVDFQQCNGCGGCSYLAPDAIDMVDIEKYGIRPQFKKEISEEEHASLIANCSGISLTHTVADYSSEIKRDLFDSWGPVLEVYEGYATSDEVRWKGSSGGAATALSLFGLETGRVEGVLHTKASKKNPLQNEAVYSTCKEEIIEGAGSRYAPSSPLSGLANVKNNRKSVVVGKPCDIASLYKIRKADEKLSESIDVSIAFFCAGVPSTKGNREYVENQLNDKTVELKGLKYRGEGWPGRWRATGLSQGKEVIEERTYAESWGVLQRSRQWRCYICPDHSGEFSDISVGDPWYREVLEEELGSSLIVVRSEKGRQYLDAAVDAGYITLVKRDDTLIDKSQPNLLEARGNLWGRLITLRLLGVAVPAYINFNFFKYWLKLPVRVKISSIFGTIKRIPIKKLRTRINYGCDNES